MTHPRPDRSNYRPNLRKTEEHPAIDIGWNEGVLSDGRPYRVECWAEEQVTSLTVFFSAPGMEDLTNADAVALLEREGLVTYRAGGFRSAAARMFTDASGQALWSVNTVIGDDEETFVDATVGLLPYSSPSPEEQAGP